MSKLGLLSLIFLAFAVGIHFVVTEKQVEPMWPDITCHPIYNGNWSYTKERGVGLANEACKSDKEGEKCLKLCVLKKTQLVREANAEDNAKHDFVFVLRSLSGFTFHNFGNEPTDLRGKMVRELKKCKDPVEKMRKDQDCGSWSEVYKCIEEPLKCS